MLSSVGFTCVAFATGSLAIWAPTFMTDAIASNGGKRDDALYVCIRFSYFIILKFVEKR